ncbi:cell adhesion molecule 2-like [Anneissia japonica]|uniref:cell adhesion molecule 2-like n=1 Tax=Anneissia japonica TaxID=1529436 RepID=UPI0014256276|nr:cell adhesion molecule 2-like [Anneissia japonica]
MGRTYEYVLLLFSLTPILSDAIELIEGPSDSVVLTKNVAILRCRVENIANEQIVWYHQDTGDYITLARTLSTKDDDKLWRYSVIGIDKDGIYDLLITDANANVDDGTYVCGYSRQPGNFVSLGSATLIVLTPSNDASPQCSVDYFGLQRPPQKGDFVQLVCESSGGNPVPNNTWYRDDEIISPKVQEQKSYFGLRLREDDQGVTFTCETSNDALREVKTCEVFPYQDVPDVTVTQTSASVLGGDTTFVCETNAKGPLRYRWREINMNILLENRFKITDNSRVLKILNLKQGDLNTTVVCEVAYQNLVSTETGKLVILKSPDILPETSRSANLGLHTSAVAAITAVVIIAILIALAAFLITRQLTRRRNNGDGTPEPVKFKMIGETDTDEEAIKGKQIDKGVEKTEHEDDIRTDLRLVDEGTIEHHEEKQ